MTLVILSFADYLMNGDAWTGRLASLGNMAPKYTGKLYFVTFSMIDLSISRVFRPFCLALTRTPAWCTQQALTGNEFR